MLAAHDLALLPAADPVTKDSPCTLTRVLLMLSYVHRAFTKKRVNDKSKWYLELYLYPMQVRQLGYIRFLAQPGADKAPVQHF